MEQKESGLEDISKLDDQQYSQLLRTLENLSVDSSSGAEDTDIRQDSLSSSPKFFVQNDNIFTVIQNGDLDKLIRVLRQSPTAVCDKNEYNQTPLHLAVENADPTLVRIEIVKLLLLNDANIFAKDDDGITPVHIAAKAPYAGEVLELLFSHAINNSFKDHQLSMSPENKEKLSALFIQKLNVQDNDGLAPLHLAVSGGRVESIESLLIHGASIDIREKKHQATPLLRCFKVAPKTHCEKALSMFLAYSDFPNIRGNIRFDVSAKDADGNTLLHYACFIKSIPSVHALIMFGASINEKNNNGETPKDFLQEVKSDEAKTILGYLNKPESVPSIPLSLPTFEKKKLSSSISSSHNSPNRGSEANQAKVVDSKRSSSENRPVATKSGSIEEISIPSRFFVRHATINDLSNDPQVLFARLKNILHDLPSVCLQFLEADKHISEVDNTCYQQLGLSKYFNRYICVMKLVESSESISHVTTISKKRLETDSSYCFLTIDQYVKLREGLNKTISGLRRQLSMIEGTPIRDISGVEKVKNIGNTSDKDLREIFSEYDVATIKSLYLDKNALNIFKIGLTQKLKEKLDLAKKYSAISNFFTCVQKSVSICEITSKILSAQLENKSGKTAETIILELKALITEFSKKTLQKNPVSDSTRDFK